MGLPELDLGGPGGGGIGFPEGASGGFGIGALRSARAAGADAAPSPAG